jgi:hypothetical protein
MRLLLTALISLAVLISLGIASTATNRGYSGLGATVRAFKQDKGSSMGCGKPPLGNANYCIDRVRHHRVFAYHVLINARPKYTNREKLSLTEGTGLPLDVKWVIDKRTCHVHRSKTLKRLQALRSRNNRDRSRDRLDSSLPAPALLLKPPESAFKVCSRRLTRLWVGSASPAGSWREYGDTAEYRFLAWGG